MRQSQRLTNLTPKIKTIGDRVVVHSFKGLYGSYRWQAFVAEMIKERGRVCERCGKTHCRIFADHIIELMDGGEAFDRKNIMLLCGSCHTKKTNEVRDQRIGAFK